MPQEITPEEKLLRLIKEGEKTPHEAESHPEVTLTQEQELYAQKASKLRTPFPLAFVQKFSGISAVFSLLFIFMLGYQFLFGRPVLPFSSGLHIEGEAFQLPSVSIKTADNFDSFQKVFEKPNIFKMIGEPPPAHLPDATVHFSDLIKNYSLSGIISGEKPQAIIEDRSNGQVYYVQDGDFLGPVQVIEVGADHVSLRYGDEEGKLTF